MNCFDCKHLIVWEGSHDMYGCPLEPDEYECTGEPTEEEIDKYFSNNEDFDEEFPCSAFEKREDDDYE